MLKWCGQVQVLCMGGNRWHQQILMWSLEGKKKQEQNLNPLNAELSPIRHLLALVGAHHIVHVSRIRVN